MSIFQQINREVYRRQTNFTYKSNWQRIHIDPVLLIGILITITIGLSLLFSASGQDFATIWKQVIRFSVAFIILLVCAQIPPRTYQKWAPTIYIIGLSLLIMVLILGVVGKGAQRWLDLGIIRFQPSEMIKLAVPLATAWLCCRQPLPPRFKTVMTASLLILLPAFMILKQPDLGTAIMVVISGGCVLLFAGMAWRYIVAIIILGATAAPFLWNYLHSYQQQRVLTFLNPERDPLGAGYHIIQSKIAIGSGGILGKGWLHGSQSQLNYIPEHATDFIFAVAGEEFGLMGGIAILAAIIFITWRAFYIAQHAQDDFSRVLAASIGLTFFFSAFVNIGMVIGILPVVGLPLPLISYGGTSMVAIMAGFGILMSIHTHRRFIT